MIGEAFRKQVDDAILNGLRSDLERAQRRMNEYLQDCARCRMVYDDLVSDYYGGADVHSFDLTRRGNDLFCPACDRHVWTDD